MVEGFRAEGLCFLYLLPCEVSVSGSKARLLGLGLSGSKHLYQNADAGGPPKLSTKPRVFHCYWVARPSVESRKMLCYADLGVHVAFDGTDAWHPLARVVLCRAGQLPGLK